MARRAAQLALIAAVAATLDPGVPILVVLALILPWALVRVFAPVPARKARR